MRVRRALISVTDKKGLVPFAQGLRRLGVEIVSTGGTLKWLKRHRIKVTPIEELTGFPEIFEGRLKTLHPKVHGGLLMVRGHRKQRHEARTHGIQPIDLVVVNLYKFEETVGKSRVTEREAVEHIDIGGPTMLRSAAKNFEYVGVISSPGDYKTVLDEMRTSEGKLSRKTRKRLATEVFRLTCAYDQAIASYFSQTAQNGRDRKVEELPQSLTLRFQKAQTLRYGENPHQRAALYTQDTDRRPGFEQLHGKELSYNNLLDIESALNLVDEFSLPAAVAIKHNNPCGVAEASDLETAAADAVECDSMSAFGGIVAVNRRLTKEAAAQIADRLAFFEIVIAPSFEPSALDIFKQRKNLRIIVAEASRFRQALALRFGPSGLLVQDVDRSVRGRENNLRQRLKCMTKVKPSRAGMKALLFAWKCVKHVRSNAIVLVQGMKTVGIGAGQMSRIDSVRIACRKAGDRTKNSILASDGFFPMSDSIEYAHKFGIRMIIQPGGSIRDADVIRACDESQIGMVLTGERHFRH